MPGSGAPTAVVVGAGVFGAATAWRLAREGFAVTLVERDEPAGPRSSSAGHSRVIRFGHGAERFYTDLAWRSRGLWRELEAETGAELLVASGAVWFVRPGATWEAEAEATMRAAGVPVERLDVAEAARLYPSFHGDDLAWALLEPEAGVLRAERGVRTLVAAAEALGATLVRGTAEPDGAGVVVDGVRHEADVVVWACGPWMGRLFPEHVTLRVARRDYVTFGVDAAWGADRVPVWVDFAGEVYGLPELDGAGFKVAPDDATGPCNPDTSERTPDPAKAAQARAHLAHRFPALATAPQRDARVCQYELTADNEFLLARHPEHPSVWLVGGGSGHGFKHGPAVGELLARAAATGAAPDERFGLHERSVAVGLRTAAADFA